MIWSVVSEEEMGSSTTSPTFGEYSKELGVDNVKLAVVNELDNLSFVLHDDIVLLRTASRQLVRSIETRGAWTTAERYLTYRLAIDKMAMTQTLKIYGIRVAPFYLLSEVFNGREYFVKPRFGNDSNVSTSNVCKTKEEVARKIKEIKYLFGQDSIICDNLSGREYTVACVRIGNDIHTYPMDINSPGKTLEYDVDSYLREESVNICERMGILHHARIDFRSDADGNIFAIDINLIPSIGHDGKWAKCFRLAGLSYFDSIESVIRTATKL